MRQAGALILLLLTTGCASVDQPVRVLVYNIHAGRDSAGVDNLERVASLIESSAADIVLLQEVDRGTTRSGNTDQLATLMRLTGMHGAFGKSLDYQGGDYGIAMLSRWPITNDEVVPLRIEPPQPRAGGSLEPRIALVAETNGLTVANTHFDASRVDTWRAQEVEELLRNAEVRRPIVAGGDFNAEPGSRIHERMLAAGMRDAWLECGEGQSLTFPAAQPVKRIDYLFLAAGATCSSATVLDSDASDHRPFLVTVTLRRGARTSGAALPGRGSASSP